MNLRSLSRWALTSGLLLVPGLCPTVAGETVDPAVVGERLVRLTSAVEALEATVSSQQRQIETLANELQKVREEILAQGNQRPWADDLKRLGDAVNEVDRKRAADGEQVVKVLNELRKAVAQASEPVKPPKTAVVERPPDRSATTPTAAAKPRDNVPEKAWPYVFQAGDSLSRVVTDFNKQARQEGYQPLTVEQVMKFNNISDAKRIRDGQTVQFPLIPK